MAVTSNLADLFIPDNFDWIESMPSQRMDNSQFFRLCSKNELVHIEQMKNGKLVVKPLPGFKDGNLKGIAAHQLSNWRRERQEGVAVGYSVGFILPDGSTHAPDAAWVSDEKSAQLTPAERKKFPPVVPDFIIEIRSQSDNLTKLKRKMEQVWIANGIRLAWLIDPQQQKTYIYRQGGSVETVSGFDKKLSGEDVCPGYEFDLSLLTL